MRINFTFLLTCFFFWLFSSGLVSAQTIDSTERTLTEPPTQDVQVSPVTIELALHNRYVWRGVSFGNSPSIQGLLSYRFKNGIEIGTLGAMTLNGNRTGYGNTLEIFVSYSYENFSFTLDDYFFFEASDSLNNYFNYSSDTQHFIEAILEYDDSQLRLMMAYNVYSNMEYPRNAVYLELGLYLKPHFQAFVGYVTERSALNFAEKPGFTNMGVRAEKTFQITDRFQVTATSALVFNPNYRNITPSPDTDIGRNPVHFLIGIIF